MPDFYKHVTKLLRETVDEPFGNGLISSRVEEDSGIDTGDSSDEKRHQAPNQVTRVKRFTSNSAS